MKTVILDFDGIVADTRLGIIETVRQTLKRLNLTPADDFAIQNVIGLPLRDTFVRAAGISDEGVIAEAISTYRALYHDISISSVRLFPNVAQTLEALYQNGLTLAVASSKGRLALLELLDYLGISRFFSCVLGEEDVAHKKPAPDMVLHVLQQTATNQREAIVVGDTTYDIRMGKAANCSTCGVSYGNHTAEQLLEAGADFIINDFARLLQIVNVGTV